MSEPKSLIEKVEADLAVEEEKVEQRNKWIEKAKYVAVGVVLGLCFIWLLVLTGQRYIPIQQYTKALQMMEAGDYKNAAQALDKLDGYGSSEYQLETIYTQFPQYKVINAKPDEMITYGTYDNGNNIAPLEWYVVRKDGNKVLLLSKDIVDAQPYSGTVDLPTWLEQTFKKTAFNDKEAAAVAEVFILNKDQVNTYLLDKEYAACVPTPFAISRGYWKNYSDDYMWWTSESSSSGKHYLAYPGGSVGIQVSADNEMNGVRPAIWITVE